MEVFLIYNTDASWKYTTIVIIRVSVILTFVSASAEPATEVVDADLDVRKPIKTAIVNWIIKANLKYGNNKQFNGHWLLLTSKALIIAAN